MGTILIADKLVTDIQIICSHADWLWYNPWNKVVQCHFCGETAWGITETINICEINSE